VVLVVLLDLGRLVLLLVLLVLLVLPLGKSDVPTGCCPPSTFPSTSPWHSRSCPPCIACSPPLRSSASKSFRSANTRITSVSM
jgi:hypothetical protein